VKQRVYPMLGFKSFRNAAIAISGIELAQKIRKGQFNITQLKGGMEVRMPLVWVRYLPIDGRLIEAIVCTYTLFAPEPTLDGFKNVSFADPCLKMLKC
jgi:hypothetical protein